ncbi:MAG TPA: hypothetical protein VK302_22885 [Terriglobales bacterium]|nr:hypothetical protein [Terriglobales bacterium]
MKNDMLIITNGTAECRICGLHFAPSEPEDKTLHRKTHVDLARGGVPQKVRDFSKAFGWAVAHNDGGLERLKDRYDSELGKLVVAYSWWSRARSNGAQERDFDAYMTAHLKYVDALVSDDAEQIKASEKAIQPWEQFAG